MKFWVPLLLCALGSTAQAQTVWRCGPEGRSYADAPCRDGRAVELAQARPAADMNSAQDMARREKSLAAHLVRERQQREAQPATGPAGIRDTRFASAAEAVKPKVKVQVQTGARATGKRRLEDADTWRAVAPVSRRGRD